MQPKFGGGERGTLDDLMIKALHPVKYLGNLGKTYDEAMDEFFKVSMESLMRNGKKTWYAGCFMTDEGLEEYYDTDEMGVHTALGHVFREKGKELRKKLDGRLSWSMKHCVKSLNAHGVEASWSGLINEMYYISDQVDMEDASFTKTGKISEGLAASIHSDGKKVGTTLSVIERYIQFLEILVSFGMNPWTVNHTEISAKYGVQHILMLNMNQMQVLIDTVKNKGWGTLP